MTDTARIALLIDADNARARRIEVILGELSAFGETSIRRAYGNWTKAGLKGWQDVLHENAIRPVQQFDPSKGKNASDMALAVDAVEILHTQRPDAFAIVSSDADFTPLVMHLREHGVKVYGFGDAKTPAPFQSACTRFTVLDRLSTPGADDVAAAEPDAEAAPDSSSGSTSDPEPPARTPRKRATAKASAPAAATGASGSAARTSGAKKAATKAAAQPAEDEPAAKKTAPAKATAPAPGRATRAQLRQDTRLVALLRRAVESAADESGWAKIGTVGQRISNQSSFDSRNYGYAKLSRLIEATDLFDVREVGTPDMAVRDPRAG